MTGPPVDPMTPLGSMLFSIYIISFWNCRRAPLEHPAQCFWNFSTRLSFRATIREASASRHHVCPIGDALEAHGYHSNIVPRSLKGSSVCRESQASQAVNDEDSSLDHFYRARYSELRSPKNDLWYYSIKPFDLRTLWSFQENSGDYFAGPWFGDRDVWNNSLISKSWFLHYIAPCFGRGFSLSLSR